MLLTTLHPDDLLFFEEVKAAMFRVAKRYELPLRSVAPMPMPANSVQDMDRLGECYSTGDIRLVLRATENGAWCDAPRTPELVWNTAAHELAHLRHMNHGVAFQEFYFEMAEALANQQEDYRDKVLAKLVKMQRQRESEASLGNDKAAEAFAAAINRMMIEFELNPTDLDYARTTDKDPVIELRVDLDKYKIEKVKTRVAWQESLARIVARAHLCTFLLAPGRNQIWFVGTKSHAMVAEYVYGILVPAANTMSQKEYMRYRGQLPKEERLAATKGYRAAWLAEFTRRVAERLDEARADAVKEAEARQVQATVPGGQSQALIRLNGALVKVQQYVDDKFKSKRSSASALAAPRSNNAAGRAAGRAAADKMPIGRKGVTGGSTRGYLT